MVEEMLMPAAHGSLALILLQDSSLASQFNLDQLQEPEHYQILRNTKVYQGASYLDLFGHDEILLLPMRLLYSLEVPCRMSPNSCKASSLVIPGQHPYVSKQQCKSAFGCLKINIAGRGPAGKWINMDRLNPEGTR